MDDVKILGIVGSLRKDSYNRWALHAAQELLPPGASLHLMDLHGIPLFNQDNETPLPTTVLRLKTKILEADAIIFATPEYNYSIPGVLKNAIDAASRPYGDSAWAGKPAAIIGASPSNFGTARAPMIAAGFPAQALSPYGRDAASIAFFNTPGIE